MQERIILYKYTGECGLNLTTFAGILIQDDRENSPSIGLAERGRYMRRRAAQTATTHLKALQHIPGIGPSLAQDLWDLGYHQIADLADADAEQMYSALEQLRGHHQDPCVLYTFRCAVYFASNEEHDPALLKWWNWKTPLVRQP
jgi:hypothetical protein